MTSKFSLFLVLPLLWPTLSFGQEEPQFGSIRGRVFIQTTKEPLIGANVVVVGTTLGAATDGDGWFEIVRVPVGTYNVRGSVIGFMPLVKTDIIVSVVRPAQVDFPLMETELELDQVVVTAEFFQKLPDTPLSTQVQSNEEIRRLPGGLEDVVRAISILPGVAQVQAGRNDLIVRGGAPSENLFVVENIEVPNINHFGTQGSSGGPLSFINLDFVRGTSFSTGGFGVRFGDKMSSVLNIDLRDGRDDHFGGKATISASQFGLNLEGPAGAHGSYLFSARRSYLDFIFKAAGFGFVPEYWDFLGKATYRLGKSDQLDFLTIAALDNVKFINDTGEKRFTNSQVLGSDQNQIVTGASWRRLFTSGYSTVTASRTYVDYFFQQNDSLLAPIFRNDAFEEEWALRGDLVWLMSKHTEVSFGVQGKFIRFENDMTLRPFWTNYGQQITVNTKLDTTAIKAATYVQVIQTLGPLRGILGGRLDYFNLLDEGVEFSPRFSLAYALSPVSNLSASVGRYIQAPSYVWLVANKNNKALRHTRVNQFILGIDHLVRADTKVSIEGYFKEYRRYPASLLRTYLVLANTGAGFGGSEDGYASFGIDPLVSEGRGAAFGLEFFVQKKLSEIPCYGTISVSYSEARFRALDGIDRPGSFDQRWILNLGGGYIVDEKWELATKFRLATGRPYTPYLPDGKQDATLYNSERVGVNHSLDVRVDRRWSFHTWTLIAYIDIQNVYNNKPADVPRYNQRTRNVEENDSIGLLPSIGISAEF